jgi:outer membrane protein assembly factor BamB
MQVAKCLLSLELDRMLMLQRVFLLLALTLFASGCSTVKGLFSGSKASKGNEPAALSKIDNTIAIKRLWSTDVGSGEKDLWLRQKPIADDAHAYIADDQGSVRAIDLKNGKTVWNSKAIDTRNSSSRLFFWRKRNVESSLTSSPGLGAGLVVVGGRNGEVVALDALSGAQKWKSKITSEVISSPLVIDDRVVIRSGDGRVFGLDVADGSRKWVFDRALPALSVRGNGSPVAGTGVVYVGYEDGTVVMLRSSDGLQGWEQAVASPDGRTELDRAADVDGEIQVGGDAVYATSYHGQTMAMSLNNGRPMWARDIGAYGGIAMNDSALILSDKQGVVHSLSRTDGSGTWKQEGLLRRVLTTPVIQGDYAVVGDLEGYLHWLKLDNGQIAGRMRVQSAGLRGTPVITTNGVLLVMSTKGQLVAYQLGQ